METMISRITVDGVIDNQLTTIDELRKQIEEKDKIIKRLRKENIDAKRPKTSRLWVKVYKDTDISFLSFRDRGIMFSLCQLVDKNRGDYLINRQTGGIITTWAGLGKSIGIKDIAHTASICGVLVDKGILIAEPIIETSKGKRFKLNPYYIAVGKNK